MQAFRGGRTADSVGQGHLSRVMLAAAGGCAVAFGLAVLPALSGAGGAHAGAGRVSDEQPAWSTDGHLIAFSSTRDGNAEIYVMNADGNRPRRLTRSPL